MNNISANVKEGEMQITLTPSKSFALFHIDHHGPVENSRIEFKHILVVVDACMYALYMAIRL